MHGTHSKWLCDPFVDPDPLFEKQRSNVYVAYLSFDACCMLTVM